MKRNSPAIDRGEDVKRMFVHGAFVNEQNPCSLPTRQALDSQVVPKALDCALGNAFVMFPDFAERRRGETIKCVASESGSNGL